MIWEDLNRPSVPVPSAAQVKTLTLITMHTDTHTPTRATPTYTINTNDIAPH